MVEYAAGGAGYDTGTAAVLAAVTFATGVLAHFGLWKPTGVSGKAQDSLVTSGSHAASSQ
jgi:hypothetical protein